MNVPSEDVMMKNPDLAPIALTKQASEFMKKFELTQAGTQFRRCREVLDRNLKTVLKRVHQQMSRSAQSWKWEILQEQFLRLDLDEGSIGFQKYDVVILSPLLSIADIFYIPLYVCYRVYAGTIVMLFAHWYRSDIPGQSGQSVPLEKLIEEIPGYGKTGQFLPTLMSQVQGLREVFSFAEIIDNTLDSLDNQVQKQKWSWLVVILVHYTLYTLRPEPLES